MARNRLRKAQPATAARPASDLVFQPPPAIHHVTREEFELSWRTRFGQFPPYTKAERELEEMLRGEDSSIDLGLANWLIASDIPQINSMTRDFYFRRLEAMTDRVRDKIEEMRQKGWPNLDSGDPSTRMQRFCSAILSLGIKYVEQFRVENLTPEQERALYRNADNVLLAGLLRTGSGCCVSLPMVYLVIGRRLGLPVHLVMIGKHCFLRWEERGYRMDIEPTITEKIAFTPGDSVYLETEGMTREQVRGCELRDLSNREVVGELFAIRSSYWGMNGPKAFNQSLIDLARARYLSPDDPKIQAMHDGLFAKYGIKPTHKAINLWLVDKSGNDISGNKAQPEPWMISAPELPPRTRSRWAEEHGMGPLHSEGIAIGAPPRGRASVRQLSVTRPPAATIPSLTYNQQEFLVFPGSTSRNPLENSQHK
ncbi:MAG TPA: transglutaminase family protein [Verrucomicrobiae bacterium]|nr:transglutaminase family protein [Verrucomicrobiae bacterium]